MRTNEKITVLNRDVDVNVRVDYFLVTKDQKLINWNNKVHLPAGWLHANVRIEQLEFTETFEGSDESKDFKVIKLYINDEFIGDLIDVKAKPDRILKFRVAVARE